MAWSQKIYLNDKTLVLTTSKEAYVLEHPDTEGFTCYTGATDDHFNLAIQQLELSSIEGVIIEDANEQAIKQQLSAAYLPVDAAGGVAYNESGEILMIFRRGKWDLPKGKRDEDENMEECALREVKEETGLKHLELADKICDTFHIYSQYGEQILKRTAWYKMSGTSKDKLKPQKEENILEARWVKEQDLGPLVDKTYEAVKEVLTLAGLKW